MKHITEEENSLGYLLKLTEAYSDGTVTASERAVLEEMRKRLGISFSAAAQLESIAKGSSKKEEIPKGFHRCHCHEVHHLYDSCHMPNINDEDFEKIYSLSESVIYCSNADFYHLHNNNLYKIESKEDYMKSMIKSAWSKLKKDKNQEVLRKKIENTYPFVEEKKKTHIEDPEMEKSR